MRYLVLPYTDHTPTEIGEILVGFSVSAQVPLDLPAPERGISYGTRVVLGTAMPETAIDEDGDLATGRKQGREYPAGRAEDGT